MKCHFYREKYKYLIYVYICIMHLGCENGKLVEIFFLFWIDFCVQRNPVYNWKIPPQCIDRQIRILIDVYLNDTDFHNW